MTADSKKSTLAVLVTLTSVLILHFFLQGFGPRIDTRAHEALGQMLAQEAIKLRGSGGRIAVLARDGAVHKNPCVDAQYAAFQRTLKRSGASIASVKFFRLNPIRLVAVPPNDFFQIIQKSTPNDVIVSFIGPPVLSDEQIGGLGEQRAQIIAVCSGWTPRQVNLRRIFEQGLLSTAIISRPDASALAAANAEETFKQNFALVTAANISELPLFASSGGAQ